MGGHTFEYKFDLEMPFNSHNVTRPAAKPKAKKSWGRSRSMKPDSLSAVAKPAKASNASAPKGPRLTTFERKERDRKLAAPQRAGSLQRLSQQGHRRPKPMYRMFREASPDTQSQSNAYLKQPRHRGLTTRLRFLARRLLPTHPSPHKLAANTPTVSRYHRAGRGQEQPVLRRGRAPAKGEASAVVIPDWDSRAVIPTVRDVPTEQQGLPENRSPYEAALLHLVERFATTPERVRLLQGLMDYRNAL